MDAAVALRPSRAYIETKMSTEEDYSSEEPAPIVEVSTRAEFDVAIAGRAPKLIMSAMVTVMLTELLRNLLDNTVLMALVGLSTLV